MKRLSTPAYLGPFTAWILFFFILPLFIIAATSFLEKGLYGGVSPGFSLTAWRDLWNPAFLKVAFSTLILSCATTLLCFGLALPAAYAIARSRYKNLLLFLIIVPFWTNFLIRIYAWIAILGNNGYLNQAFLFLGWVTDPVQFLYNGWSVTAVMTYTFLPYAILPLYASIERFDFSLIEAAEDLGAGAARAHALILLPNIRAGITASILFTLIPSLGQYAIPQLIGGRNSFMLGNLIARELTVSRNWPLAAALSILLTLITTLGILLFLRFNQRTRKAVE
jgi:spermidine/putrescine transport system permease protein